MDLFFCLMDTEYTRYTVCGVANAYGVQYFILDLHPAVYIREPPQTFCLGFRFEREKIETKTDLTFNLISFDYI